MLKCNNMYTKTKEMEEREGGRLSTCSLGMDRLPGPSQHLTTSPCLSGSPPNGRAKSTSKLAYVCCSPTAEFYQMIYRC
jgi:hypothetical protein